MGARQKRINRRVWVGVDYGMGGSVSGEFPRDELAGKRAGEVVWRVLGFPQRTGTAARTAKVLSDAIKAQRAIDAEVFKAASRRAQGEPITFDDVLVPRDGDAEQDEGVVVQETEEITIRLSENYCGGEGVWRSGRSGDRG